MTVTYSNVNVEPLTQCKPLAKEPSAMSLVTIPKLENVQPSEPLFFGNSSALSLAKESLVTGSECIGLKTVVYCKIHHGFRTT